MSMPPNNPFDRNQRTEDQRFGRAPEPRGSSTKFWLLGCGIAGLLVVLICCGGIVMIGQFGGSMLAGQLREQVDGHPVIEEHIGEIESLEMSWGETFERAQAGGDEAEELAFTIEGSKGSGVLMVQQDQQGEVSRIESAVLVMPDGNRYPIELEPGLGDVDPGPQGDFGDMIDDGVPAEEEVPEPVEPGEPGAEPEPAIEP